MSAKYTRTETFDCNAPLRVDSVKVEWIDDPDADTSWIGEYSNQATSAAAIDRQARGDCGRGEYRYFNPAMTGEETGNPESPEQDYQRMDELQRGGFGFVGCRVVAEVSYPCGSSSRRLETFRSGGLWGIESDCGDDYRKEVEAQETADLKAHLAQFGIPWPVTELEAA